MLKSYKTTSAVETNRYFFLVASAVFFIFCAPLLIPQHVFAMPGGIPGTKVENSTTLGIVRTDLTTPERNSIKGNYFEGVNGCTCHRELLNQWSDSMHKVSLSDPFFVEEYSKVQQDQGQEAADFCLGCHAPGELFTDGTGPDTATSGTDGLLCTVCHQIVGQTSENKDIGNASFGYHPDGPDQVYRAQLADPVATHRALEEPYYNTSEFCANCHNISLESNGLEVLSTYDEWLDSSYSKEDKSCQNCHMFKDPKTRENPYTGIAAVSSKEHDNISAMTFVGANVEQSNQTLVEALLASAASVKIEYDGDDILQAGEKADVNITVTNTGTGHALPGGILGQSQMWLSVSSVDIEGKDPQEVGRIDFSSTLIDDAGDDVGAAFYRATKVGKDNRIMPGETKQGQFTFTMPADTENRYLQAELKYKTARDKDIEPAGIDNPITTMVSTNQGFYVSEEAKAEALAIRAEQQRIKDSGGLLINDEDTGINWPQIMLYAGVGAGVVLVISAVVFLVLRNSKKPRHSCKKCYSKYKRVNHG